MTPTEQFLRTPMSFLEKNLVLTPLELSRAGNQHSGRSTLSGLAGAADGVYFMGLSKLERMPSAGKVVRGIRNGAICSVYELIRKSPGDKDTFKAYWWSGRNGKPIGLVVGDKASMLFSTTKGKSVNPGVTQGATVFGRISQVSHGWVFYALKYDCSAVPGMSTYTHKGLVGFVDAAA